MGSKREGGVAACRCARCADAEGVAAPGLRLREADVGSALSSALSSTGTTAHARGANIPPLQMAIIYLRSLTRTGSRLAPWWRWWQRYRSTEVHKESSLISTEKSRGLPDITFIYFDIGPESCRVPSSEREDGPGLLSILEYIYGVNTGMRLDSCQPKGWMDLLAVCRWLATPKTQMRCSSRIETAARAPVYPSNCTALFHWASCARRVRTSRRCTTTSHLDEITPGQVGLRDEYIYGYRGYTKRQMPSSNSIN